MAANPYQFNIMSETELGEILSHYETEYVLNVVEMAIRARFSPNTILPQPNVVNAWEQNFKQIMATFDSATYNEKVMHVRNETYREIIAKICKEFSLNFTIDDNVDLYSAAYFLYDFFVANFNAYMVKFFYNHIFKERSNIYDSLGLATYRKSKDSSTSYGKRLYKDIKLAVINANIDMVVGSISGNDIPLDYVINTVMPKDKANYMNTLVSDAGDFFKNYYYQILQCDIRPTIITDIRFGLHNIATSHEDQQSENE